MGHRRYPFWSTEADVVVKATSQGLLAGSGIIEESRQVPEPRINADQKTVSHDFDCIYANQIKQKNTSFSN